MYCVFQGYYAVMHCRHGVRMYVCMSAYAYVCMCTYVCACMRVHVCIYTTMIGLLHHHSMYVCMYVHVRMYVHMNVSMHVSKKLYVYVLCACLAKQRRQRATTGERYFSTPIIRSASVSMNPGCCKRCIKDDSES